MDVHRTCRSILIGATVTVLLGTPVAEARQAVYSALWGKEGERWDNAMLDYLDGSGLPYVDALAPVGEEYKGFKLPIESFLERFYVGRAGAQVFGHYKAQGNFWFASVIKQALVDWLEPKPPAYR